LRRLACASAIVASALVLSGAGQATRARHASYVCTIKGTSGPDVLFGGNGRDVICGYGGNDQLFGLAGSDVLIGGLGNDYLEGGAGSDVMLGGTGNDSFRSYDGGRDVVDGGPGVDGGWSDHFDVVRNVEHPG
jgi:Ca2+-binding RTX toxin-like protein